MWSLARLCAALQSSSSPVAVWHSCAEEAERESAEVPSSYFPRRHPVAHADSCEPLGEKRARRSFLSLRSFVDRSADAG
ncbi:hypothetical protein MTO96_011924 [Rhipicephalus appendiculatus]